MIEPISSRAPRRGPKQPRFRTSIEDLSRQARSKYDELQGKDGKYTLPSGDDMQVQKRNDGMVEFDVSRRSESNATLELSLSEQGDARINQLEDADELGSGAQPQGERTPDPYGRGQLLDVTV